MNDFDENELDKAFRQSIEGQHLPPPPGVWKQVQASALQRKLIHYQQVNTFLKVLSGSLAAVLAVVGYLFWKQAENRQAVVKTDTVFVNPTRTDSLPKKAITDTTAQQNHFSDSITQTTSHDPNLTLPENTETTPHYTEKNKLSETAPDASKEQNNALENTPTHTQHKDFNIPKNQKNKYQVTENQDITQKNTDKPITKTEKQKPVIQQNTEEITQLQKKKSNTEILTAVENETAVKEKKTKPVQPALTEPSQKQRLHQTQKDPTARQPGDTRPYFQTPDSLQEIALLQPKALQMPDTLLALKVPERLVMPSQQVATTSKKEPEKAKKSLLPLLDRLSLSIYGSPDGNQLRVQESRPSGTILFRQATSGGLTAGLRVGFRVGQRFSLLSGLEYSRFSYSDGQPFQTLEAGEPHDKPGFVYPTILGAGVLSPDMLGFNPRPGERIQVQVKSPVQVSYWQVPLGLRYTFWQKTLGYRTRLHLYALAGGYLTFPKSQQADLEVRVPFGREYPVKVSHFEFTKPSWGLQAGAGAEISFLNRLWFFAEPGYARDAASLVSGIPVDTYRSRLSLKMGVSWHF